MKRLKLYPDRQGGDDKISVQIPSLTVGVQSFKSRSAEYVNVPKSFETSSFTAIRPFPYGRGSVLSIIVVP
jgi:hypothetical protein